MAGWVSLTARPGTVQTGEVMYMSGTLGESLGQWTEKLEIAKGVTCAKCYILEQHPQYRQASIKISSHTWWLVTVIPALFQSLSQDSCHEFQISLHYIVTRPA